MLPSQIISQTYTGTTTQSGDPYEVIKNPLPKTPQFERTTPPGSWAISDKEKAHLFASYLADVFSPHDQGMAPDIERNLDKPVHPQKPPTSIHDAPTNTGDQKAKNTEGSRRRPCYDSNTQGVTARRTHLPPPYP